MYIHVLHIDKNMPTIVYTMIQTAMNY